jgi:hypothetical protein
MQRRWSGPKGLMTGCAGSPGKGARRRKSRFPPAQETGAAGSGHYQSPDPCRTDRRAADGGAWRAYRIDADSGLAPDATLEQLIALITSRRKLGSIMLVGHEPLLGQAAALLLGREEVAGLAKGGCLCLELRDKPDKPARFLWYAPVSGKLISSAKKALVPKP